MNELSNVTARLSPLSNKHHTSPPRDDAAGQGAHEDVIEQGHNNNAGRLLSQLNLAQAN